MSSHSDSDAKVDSSLKIKKTLFKAKHKIDTDLIKALKTRLHPELQQQRLLSAVSLHNTETVEELLKTGTSANTADSQLRSALHIAASRGYADVVKLLLSYGAEPNNKDIIQNTPLHLAACTSNLQIITLLIDGGADIRLADMHGRNPLQIAESKLQMLQKSWKKGAIEMIQLRSQLEEVIDIMISLWKHKESTMWGHHRENVEDLEFMKLSIHSGLAEEVDDQMIKLLSELQQFTIK